MCKIFKKTVKKPLELSDLEVGTIVKMNPGYYTKKPYFILIKKVTNTGITTTIPGKHDLELDMIKDKKTWLYQTSRMEIIGNESEYGHLLINQKL
jgi:hypothetical protein